MASIELIRTANGFVIKLSERAKADQMAYIATTWEDAIEQARTILKAQEARDTDPETREDW